MPRLKPDSPIETHSISVLREQWERCGEIANEIGSNRSTIIRLALAEYLARYDKAAKAVGLQG